MPAELGTCGYFELFHNRKCYYWLVPLSKFDWGLVILIGPAQNYSFFKKQDWPVCGANESHVSREEFIDVLTVQEAKSKGKEYRFPGFSSILFCRDAFAHLHSISYTVSIAF